MPARRSRQSRPDTEEIKLAAGRRLTDDSTKKVMAYGIGGGSVIGVLLSIFAFMNSAPWATKGELAAIVQDNRRLEAALRDHVINGHPDTNAKITALEVTLTNMNDKLQEIKSDVKDIKERRK